VTPSLDITTLRLFLAVVEERSMAKAAEREHITTPAISKRIVELEALLDVQLLHRSNIGVKPTAAGLTLANDARNILAALAAAQGKLSDYSSGARGEVRISANPTSILGSLPRDIQTFASRYPQVRIWLDERSSSQVVQAVASGETDIGIFFPDVPKHDLDVFPYQPVDRVLIAPAGHPLASRERIAFEETAEFDFVLHPEASRLGALVVRAAAACGFAIRCKAHVETQEGMRRLVEAGLGVAVVPERSAVPYAALHHLACVRITDDWARLQTALCTRREALSMSARLLLALIRESASARPDTNKTTRSNE